jgi:hypothetical protein
VKRNEGILADALVFSTHRIRERFYIRSLSGLSPTNS